MTPACDDMYLHMQDQKGRQRSHRGRWSLAMVHVGVLARHLQLCSARSGCQQSRTSHPSGRYQSLVSQLTALTLCCMLAAPAVQMWQHRVVKLVCF
jgi:hypothetical protein